MKTITIAALIAVTLLMGALVSIRLSVTLEQIQINMHYQSMALQQTEE